MTLAHWSAAPAILLLHAKDDPIIPFDTLPLSELPLISVAPTIPSPLGAHRQTCQPSSGTGGPSNLTVVCSPYGGHCGFNEQSLLGLASMALGATTPSNAAGRGWTRKVIDAWIQQL